MTGVLLPAALPAASGWSLVDNLTDAKVTGPAIAGTATADFGQLPDNELWLIDHAVVFCDSAAATTVRWYAGDTIPSRLLDGSDSGNFDVGDWPAGLLIRPSQNLLVQWSGADDLAVGTVTIQYRLLRRT
ncbi:hypothetical protein Q6348_08090 [Isoptericola sp. b441]|uniref:Uncharacterized protein n=1 Tax=Actinotalea lenta TaxID=3064654 RepID=A0ABT9D9A4_9CELL|nr:hypothetical protein [Isoptericola sp. b441]MDO8107155.1 hypothetical protein [Isoptericola sp. b441]